MTSAHQAVDVDLRSLLADHLEDDIEEATDHDDLIEFGLNSMGMIHIASFLRERGYDVNFAALAKQPTIAAWEALLAQQRGRVGVASTADSATDIGSPGASDADDDSDDTFALATMQHAYWVGRRDEQSMGGVAAHLYAEFDGADLDPERLERAVHDLVGRHQMLRARFLENGTQRVEENPSPAVFAVRDLRDRDSDALAAELEQLRHVKSHQLLDVAAGHVFDVTLTLLPQGRTRLHVDVDMLAADAMSYRTLMADLAAFYTGREASLGPIGYQYRDYLAQKRHANREERAVQQRWWRDHLQDLPDPPQLPLVPEAQRVDPHLTTRRNYHVTPEQKANLLRSAHRRGVTPAVVLAAVFADVVGRWSSAQRFLLNLPLFNREPFHPDVARLVGDFSSSVMVTVDTTETKPFLEFAKELQESLHSSALHAAYPGLDVIRDLGRYRGEAVLAPVVYTSGLDLGELFADSVIAQFGDPVWIVSQGPQVVLDAQVVELRGGLLVNWDVREHAFLPGVIDAMFARYSESLDRLLAADADADWDRPLGVQPDAAQLERRRADNFRPAQRSRKLLHQRFFEVAAENPESVAVCHLDAEGAPASLSYGELADRALRVAAALRAAGVTPGAVVSIQVPKGPAQIVAVLGVLAAGATYLPIGMDQPSARRTEMETIAAVAVAIVADRGIRDDDSDIAVLVLDEALAGESDDFPIYSGPDTDSAYILFTSGSTGTPKGVVVSHGAVMNTLERCRDAFDLTAADRSIALSALEFDLSIEDTFGLFDIGGSVVMIDESTRRDGQRIAALIDTFDVTQLYCVPGILDMVLTAAQGTDALRSVRTVVVGGDRVGIDLPRRVFALCAGDAVFAGLGGCTETSIHHTLCVVPRSIADPATGDAGAGDSSADHSTTPDWTTVPFGRPLAGVGARVVAADSGADCPDWVAGELWIAGTGLADGYLGDPDRTRERFVEHDGHRWYRTGDLVRYRGDGEIEFLGRIDKQVKLRGYRIEPGEIEAALRSVDGVGDAVVVINTRRGAARLCALVVPSADSGVDQARLENTAREALTTLLPSYMIPELIEIADAIPLTGNGKVDQNAILAITERRYADDDYVAPRTNVERALTLILGEILDAERVGIDDDFFRVGGDSVRGTTAVARIMEGLDTQELSVGDLFLGRTVRGLAERMLARASDPQRLEAVAQIYCEIADMSDDQVAEMVSE
ncbi:MAG: amino acid adenylation domain-containing protein [Gordonia sp. (in: high G+C Gram-positive bacteria)]